jgi:DNA-binding transcriptional LysR family regulator
MPSFSQVGSTSCTGSRVHTANLFWTAVATLAVAFRQGRAGTKRPEDLVSREIATGRLVRVLADWRPLSSGYHLYYPRRRQLDRAFTLLVDALRCRA